MSGQAVCSRPAWKRILRLAILAYVLTGCLYGLLSLYCYNVRNWASVGGFSLPPLFWLGALTDWLAWPVHLRADWINRVGLFGGCV